MNRSLTEKQVLKKLGIPDFRHMTKDKVVRFVSMLPYMDPEVAKKALEQFPAFADLARTIVTEYKVIVDTLIKDNASSQNSVYGSCNNILDSLRDELLRDDLTPEERDRIEDKMIEVAKILSEKDSENKKFLTKVTVVADPCIWHGFASAARDASDLQPVLLPIGLYIDLFQHSIGSWMRICYMINS